MLENQEPTTVQDVEPTNDIGDDFDDVFDGMLEDDLTDSQDTNGEKDDDSTDTDGEGDDSSKSKEGDDLTEPSKQTSDDGEGDDSTDEGTDKKPFLNIKYDKKDMELSQEETITLAQKGMNYDRLKEKTDSLSKTNARLEAQAKQNGMTVDEYLDSLDVVQQQFEKDKALKEAKEKYPEADENLLKELVESKIAANRKDKELNDVNTMTKIVEEQNANIGKQIDKFIAIHPEIKVDQIQSVITDDMLTLMGEGYTISEAYDVVKSKEAKSSNSVKDTKPKVDKKADNKSKSLGNIGHAGSTEPNDDFMSGFEEAMN